MEDSLAARSALVRGVKPEETRKVVLMRWLPMLLTLSMLFVSVGRGAEPVRVIFDTDITGDVDDVLALAMLHTLQDRNQCELLAVTISKVNPLTGPFTDAVNTFYGRPDIAIGITRDAQVRDSRYLSLVSERDGGEFRYPHDLLNNNDAPEAVAM